MADISKIKPLGSDTIYNIKDNSAIANITRDGTTFTATRRDGTTFTFTQQDNNSDTKVNVVARGTTKAYLLADTTAPTSTAAAHTAVAETGVYLDTTAGKLVATSFAGSGIGLTDLREAYLTWGGRNFSGSYGCIDAAMVGELGANRLMFAKAAGITIEYSRDGGSTWTNYGATDVQKVGLFSTGGTFVIGKADSTNKATANGTNYQLRVTLNTGSASIYTALNKFVIYVSTNGSNGSTVTIQRALQSSPDTYSDIATNISISGWSGYNVINVASTTTYGNTAASQYGRIRFIFRANGGSTSYNGLTIQKIMGFGGVGWTTPSTMAKTGHLYSFDASQNATFPANVTATKFIGPLQGNADSATEFSSNTTVKLTGDATGESAGSKKGWSVPVTLANSGVTAGSYGPSANAEPGYGATFDVPYITVDAKGRITSASTKTVKIPASDEQDHRDEGYGKITPAGDTGTSAVTANTTQITAKSYNEGFTFKTGNKWLTVAGTESATAGSDILTIGHKAGLTAKSSYGSTATTASADGGTIKVTDVQYDEAGHITASTDRTITLSQVKNTAGSTDTTSKIFLIGATSQAANPQTYSDSEVYVTNGTLYLVKTQDLSGTANNKPALIVGGADTSTHMEFDCNEIQAKTNGTSVAQLYLNNDGGLVTVGSGGLAVTSLTASQAVSTDANKKLVSTNLSVTDSTADNGIQYVYKVTQSAVGKITVSKSNIRSASTSQTGVVQLNSATNSTSTTEAATPSAVKSAYDLANSHKYWADIEATSAATYNKAPELAVIKLNGNTSAAAASTKNVQLTYDSALEVLNFVFS